MKKFPRNLREISRKEKFARKNEKQIRSEHHWVSELIGKKDPGKLREKIRGTKIYRENIEERKDGLDTEDPCLVDGLHPQSLSRAGSAVTGSCFHRSRIQRWPCVGWGWRLNPLAAVGDVPVELRPERRRRVGGVGGGAQQAWRRSTTVAHGAEEERWMDRDEGSAVQGRSEGEKQ